MMKTDSSLRAKAGCLRYGSLLLLTAILSARMPAVAVPPPGGPAPVVSPAGGFGIDGDLLSGSPLTGVGDWLQGPNGSDGVLNASGQPVNPAFTFHFVDPYGNSGADFIFAGGLKWTDNPNTWGWTPGKPSSKTEINNVLLHITDDTNGHVWAVMSADRASTSGDSYIDFELLQNVLVKTNDGKFASSGPHGGRTVNDLLLSLAFTGGGKTADFFAWRWMPDGAGGYAYVDATASLPVGKVFVALNSNSIAVPYGAFGANTYAANAFAEAAIDLTALLGNFDPCLSFGFKTIMIKTKASASSSASIEDFIDPIQYSLRIGPGADAGLDQSKCTEGEATTFTLQGKASAGLSSVASSAWTLIEGAAAINNPSNLNTTVLVSSSKAVLRLTVVQANGCTATDDVALTVRPLPACSIAGPETVCPGSLRQFVAPSGQASSWSVTGSASIIGSATNSTVTVQAGPNCGETFSVTLSALSNACASACSMQVLIQDTNAPSLSIPSDLVLECPADVRTNVTGIAAAQDDCGTVNVAFVDSVTNLCGGAKIIARTWTASDTCGNSASQTQFITVRDTRAPALTVPQDITLECPAEVTTGITGTASATDTCGAVSVAFSDNVTPGCAGTKTISRLWTATDECGNVATATQRIVVRDTTRPSLVIPADIVLDCPNDGGTNAAGIALAADSCGNAFLSYTDIVSTNCGTTKVIQRTWQAVDDCGNVTNATQRVTVRDIQPPTLHCPPSLVLECPSDTGTNATGVATAEDTCGRTFVTYQDAVTNVCGLASGVVRTWTARDECGNSVSAVQTIILRDTTAPRITAPPNITLECPGTLDTNVTGIAVASDDCGSITIAFADAITNLCGNTKVVSRRWTAADQCGNASSAMQVITIRDTTPPVLICPADVTLECPSAGTTEEAGAASATDICGAATVRFTDAVQNLCGNTKIITRTWTATDQCGNATNRTQKITVRDTTAPELTIPPNAIVECGSSTMPAATGNASGSDTCGAASVSYKDVVTASCGATRTIARTWTAVDACGNTTNKVQTITVRDTTAPALTVPANLVLECPGDTRTSATGVATAQDVCGSPSVTYSDVTTNACGATKTVLRTWTATDACGNTTNALQTIAVVDTKKPTITCPQISVQCPGDVPVPFTSLSAFTTAGGRASDACAATLAFALLSDSGIVGSCPGTVTRVYRVMDECGNYADGVQRITVHDTTKPIITCPPAMTLQCGDDIANLDRTGRATATDNCDTNVLMSHTDAVVDSSYSIKWYASDPGLNNAPYLPTYVKLSPANIACPAEALTTGRAADPLRNAVAYGPTTNHLDALTSLGGEPMHFGQVVPFQAVITLDGGPGPENGTLEFRAAWSTHTTSNDEFGYDKNYMVLCAFVDTADLATYDPHRNARVESYRAELADAGTINEQIRGTFRVTGLDVGDRVTVEIWVALKNAAPRNFGGTIASELLGAWKPLNPPVPLATGNQTVSIGNLSKITPLPAPQEQPPLPPLPPAPPVPVGRLVSVVDRTWTALDDCGNSSSCSQRFSIWDTNAPALIAPQDVQMEAPGNTSTNATGIATAADGCGAAQITYSDSVVTNCGMARVITRTWTASDGANSVSANQIIRVVDTTPPVFAPMSEAANTVIAGDAWNFHQPSASDTCSPVTIRVVTTVTNITDGVLTATRTWEAQDLCGNKSETSQTIVVLSRPAILSGPVCQTLVAGGNGSLAVTAAGSGPMAYQWRLNGVNIPGATGASMNIAGAGFSHAGLYCVAISNAAGIVESPAAMVNVAPLLQTALAGNLLQLSWPAGFILQYAGNPAGPYLDVPNAVSPFTYDPAAGIRKFFRLRSAPFGLTSSVVAGGAASISITGSPGCLAIIQACDDGVTWQSLHTNTAPCAYLDTDAAGHPGRAYRAIPAPMPGSATVPPKPTLAQGPANKLGAKDGGLELSAQFTGSGLLYQWQKNGRDIPDATASSLSLKNLKYSDAGVFTLIAGNGGGSIVSTPSIVNVAPRMAIRSGAVSPEISWDGAFILQSASTPAGPYADMAPQPAGASFSPAMGGSGANQFFRLRSKPFGVSMQAASWGMQMDVLGSPGCNFVLQYSTNMTTWTSVLTNTVPCRYMHTNAISGSPVRQYFRAIPAK